MAENETNKTDTSQPASPRRVKVRVEATFDLEGDSNSGSGTGSGSSGSKASGTVLGSDDFTVAQDQGGEAGRKED